MDKFQILNIFFKKNENLNMNFAKKFINYNNINHVYDIFINNCIINKSPDDIFMANYYMIYNNYDTAETIYLYLLKSVHDNLLLSYISNNLGLCYQKNENVVKAKKYFHLSSPNKKAFYNLACLYYKEDNYKDAEKYFLLSCDYGYSKSYYYLGFLYHKILINYDKAIEFYKLSLNDDQHMFLALKQLGKLFFDLKKYVEAKEIFSNILLFDKHNYIAMNYLTELSNIQ